MKYLFQFLRIIAVCFLAELFSLLFPFPIPASVYGLILMLFALKTGIYRIEQVKDTGMLFVDVLTFLFIPTAVGVMDQWEELHHILPVCFVSVFGITFLVLGVTGVYTQWIHKKLN